MSAPWLLHEVGRLSPPPTSTGPPWPVHSQMRPKRTLSGIYLPASNGFMPRSIRLLEYHVPSVMDSSPSGHRANRGIVPADTSAHTILESRFTWASLDRVDTLLVLRRSVFFHTNGNEDEHHP